MNRKFSLLAVALIGTASVFAQDDAAKTVKDKGPMLPEAGDIGVGFDVMPFVNFMFSSIGNTPITPAFAGYASGQNAIWGKYFLDESTAIRVQIRPGFGSTVTTNKVKDEVQNLANPGLNNNVEDERKISHSNLVIGGGLEKRRGKGRIQGFYGGELMFSMTNTKTAYTYGNNFSDDYSADFTDDFDLGTFASGNTRIKESDPGKTMGIGLRGLLGVEYFIAPKLSIAAEYGWGFSYVKKDENVQVMEAWQNSATITSTSTTSGTNRDIGVDTDISGASIRMMFHF